MNSRPIWRRRKTSIFNWLGLSLDWEDFFFVFFGRIKHWAPCQRNRKQRPLPLDQPRPSFVTGACGGGGGVHVSGFIPPLASLNHEVWVEAIDFPFHPFKNLDENTNSHFLWFHAWGISNIFATSGWWRFSETALMVPLYYTLKKN